MNDWWSDELRSSKWNISIFNACFAINVSCNNQKFSSKSGSMDHTHINLDKFKLWSKSTCRIAIENNFVASLLILLTVRSNDTFIANILETILISSITL